MMKSFAVCVLIFTICYTVQAKISPLIVSNGKQVSPPKEMLKDDAVISQFPYHAFLRSTGANDETEIECSGSIISTKLILTAGLCVYETVKWTVNYDTILNNMYAKNYIADNGYAASFYTPGDWLKNLADDDIQPIPKKPFKLRIGTQVVISGYGGFNKEDYKQSSSLQFSKLRVDSQIRCLQDYDRRYANNETLCTIGVADDKCLGDIGAPVTYYERNDYGEILSINVVGISSYGYCEDHKDDGKSTLHVPTTVQWVIDWVNEQISKS